MNRVAILQARTTSFRLPAKVLLPIKNIPLVVLAAKRAANTGIKVIVATSYCDTDDELSAVVKNNNIPLFRGSLTNTLHRFVDALQSYNDNTIVFRLTADNVFPDGILLDKIEVEFLHRKLEYLCCNGLASGLPYGFSVEITRLAHLREALKKSCSAFDREHVTPFIIKKFGMQYFEKYKHLKKGHYRCTVDSLDDYLSVARVFSKISSPVSVSSFLLIEKLGEIEYQPIMENLVPTLVLGTAQMGMPYGITNTTGQPSNNSSEVMIKTAISNGVCYLDTARSYGNCEEVIGNALKSGWRNRVNIITKLSPLSECPLDASKETIHALVEASVYQSCCTLQVQNLDVLMVHRASQLEQWNGEVWRRLLTFKHDSFIKELGVSIQNEKELEKALATDEVTYIQMPFNIFDWRFNDIIPKIILEKRNRKIVIHARSSLLQGLLQSLDSRLWKKAGVENYQTTIEWLNQQVTSCNRCNTVDLCLAYLRAFNWIDGVVVGVDNMQQLRENIQYFNTPPLTEKECQFIQKNRPLLNKQNLDPALWEKP